MSKSTHCFDELGNEIHFGDIVEVRNQDGSFVFQSKVSHRADGEPGFRCRYDDQQNDRHGWAVYDLDGEPCYGCTVIDDSHKSVNRVLSICAAACIAIIVACSVALFNASTARVTEESVYHIVATVREVEADSVTVEAEDGTLWAFYGTGFEVGDPIQMDMGDNGTEGIYDDMILDARKLGN